MASGVGQQRVVVDMFEDEDEEGLTEVYKPLRKRQRSLPTLKPQQPVNLAKTEVDLESDLDRQFTAFGELARPNTGTRTEMSLPTPSLIPLERLVGCS